MRPSNGRNASAKTAKIASVAKSLRDATRDDATATRDDANACAAREEIAETLFDSLNVFSNTYALACGGEFTAEDRLIFNIIELGGRDAVKRIIDRKRKSRDEQSV